MSAALDRSGRPLSLAAALRDDRLRGLPAAPIDELCGAVVTRASDPDAVVCELPTGLGDFRVLATTGADGGDVTVTLIHGDPADAVPGLVHTHVACLLGDTFGSLLCDCRVQLERAAAEIVARGAGVLVYVKTGADDPFACPRAA
jgi:hypothetical protein